MNISRYMRALKLFALIFSLGGLSACVSDTLSSTNTQPQALPVSATPQDVPSYDPAQREQAIAEIRQKAANANSGELTNAYAAQDGPNEPLRPSQSAARIEALQQAAERNESVAGSDDLAAKQRRIRELQEKARTHYGSAVNTIQN